MLDRHLEKWIVPLTEEVLRFHAVKISGHELRLENDDDDDDDDDDDETTKTAAARPRKHVNNKCDSHLCVSHAPNVKSFTRVCYGARCENNRSIFPAQRERFGTGYQDAEKVHAEARRDRSKIRSRGVLG